MKRVVKYMVISGYDEDSFDQQVNAIIEERWQPFGNLVVAVDSEGCFYYSQTVVLYEGEI